MNSKPATIGFALGFLFIQVGGKPAALWVSFFGIAALALVLADLVQFLTKEQQ